MLLAIDPGASTGWALLNEGELTRCGLGDPRVEFDHVGRAQLDVVVERPWHRPGDRRSNPNDEITLALIAGELAGAFPRFRYVAPHTWKGSVPKDIHHARVWAKLSPAEREIVDAACKGVAPSKRHNILDSIGLGLWALCR